MGKSYRSNEYRDINFIDDAAIDIYPVAALRSQRVYKVGILSGSDAFIMISDGFKAKMAELGYSEGKNIIFDLQKANASQISEEQIAKKFVEEKVDLILAYPTETALIAKSVAKDTDIPIVFANAGIEGSDLVQSIRAPGGNITGVRFPGPDLTVKRLELLLELAPNIKRIGLPYDPSYPNNPPAIDALRAAASSSGVILVEMPISSLDDLKSTLESKSVLRDVGFDAIQIMSELITTSPDGFKLISDFASARKLPIAGSALTTADRGAVFGYAADPFDMGGLAAALAAKIFNGTPAGTIPVVSPEAFLRLNYKLAKELNLSVSEGC